MRSELIFGAIRSISNRYLLSRLTSKATRLLHRPNTRIEDTTNEALRWLKGCEASSTTSALAGGNDADYEATRISRQHTQEAA